MSSAERHREMNERVATPSKRTRAPNGALNPARELALRIGITHSCARRWQVEGCPLPEDVAAGTAQDFRKIVAWLHERPTYKVPVALVRLAYGTVANAVQAHAPTGPAVAPNAEPLELGDLDTGLRAEMRRLELEAAMNFKLYKQFENGDPAMRTSYFKVWQGAVMTLAKVAKEVPDHELEEGKVILVVDIERAVRTMVIEFRLAMDALPFRLTSLLRSITDPVEMQAEIEREKNSVLEKLRNINWKTKIDGTSSDTDSGPSITGPATEN